MTKVFISSIKHHVLCRKSISNDTGWKTTNILPRFSPFAITRPCAARWQWRSIALTANEGAKYRLFFDVSPQLGKWKAVLVFLPAVGEATAIARFEDQPGKYGGGLHIHANCDQNAEMTGADSIEMVYTLPEHGMLRRRREAWTPPLFCQKVGQFVRTDPLVGQEELFP